VNDDRMHSIPMILETPAPEQEIWAEEIKLLYWMVGKAANDPELLAREKELQEKGKEDREKQLESLKKRDERREKETTKRRKRGKKKADVESSESPSESEDASDSESESDSGHQH
jgi:hypothetical protein